MTYTLYRHQHDASSLLMGGSSILWWEMRTGKSRAVLYAHDELNVTGEPVDLVIVCPQITKDVWLREVERMDLPYQVGTLDGEVHQRATFRFVDDWSRGTVWILNWEILAYWQETLSSGSPYNLCLDESHRFLTNPNSATYRATRRLTQKARRTWLLTGTLFKSSALDLYWQCRLLGDDNPFSGVKPDEFGERYCHRKWNAFKGRDRKGGWEYSGLLPNAEDEILARAPMISKLLESDLAQPIVHERLIEWLPEHADRIAETVSYARSLGGPVVIAGWHVPFLEAVSSALRAPLLNGSTSARNKARLAKEFQEGKYEFVCINILSAGMSLDLSRARHMVFGEMDWDQVNHIQAEARIKGPNQTADKVYYHYLLQANSEDDKIASVRLRKQQDITRLDKAGKEIVKIG